MEGKNSRLTDSNRQKDTIRINTALNTKDMYPKTDTMGTTLSTGLIQRND